MTLVGCDLHSRKQQVAVLDTRTGELLEQELAHDGDAVERFYRALPPPVTIVMRRSSCANGWLVDACRREPNVTGVSS